LTMSVNLNEKSSPNCSEFTESPLNA